MRATITAGLLLCALLVIAPSSGALDNAKPTPCGTFFIKDPPGDAATRAGLSPENLDITQAFFKYDPAAKDPLTANIVVKNMSLAIPADAPTGANWTFAYNVADGSTHFVRLIADILGESRFEYGTVVPPIGGLVLPRFQPDGDTAGKTFDGPDGLIQIAIPPRDAKVGLVFKSPYAEASESIQLIPASIQTPTRGLSTVVDDAPDSMAGVTYTVAACTGAGAGATGAAGAAGAVAGALPVTVGTKSASASKASKSKSLAVKLTSQAPITTLKGTLSKGKAVVGKGKLAKLDGKGTLKLKLKKKLSKGSYVLALQGNTAGGPGTASAKISVR